MPYCVGNKGGGSPVVSAQENNAPVLRIFDLFITRENPKTPRGEVSWLE
jgi:hypothetical protein